MFLDRPSPSESVINDQSFQKDMEGAVTVQHIIYFTHMIPTHLDELFPAMPPRGSCNP